MKFFRLIHIVHIIFYYQLIDLIPAYLIPRLLRFFFFFSPYRLLLTKRPPEQRLHLALEKLGPIFIKLGQLLSTRRDLFPENWINELAKLQDKVAPFSSKTAYEIIERELLESTSILFKHIDEIPLASASLAQVHSAKLHTGEEVVIKILRPNVTSLVTIDLAWMKWFVEKTEALLPQLHWLHLGAIITDYESTLMDELNFTHEAGNMEVFRKNFYLSPLLYVPKVYWDYVTPRVLVMERVYGLPVNDIATFKKAGVNLEVLSQKGLEIFFTQVFRDNFFHADMHPGNILVTIDDPANPQYIALDCAIVGKLEKDDQILLARQLMALIKQDYRELARLLVQASWVGNKTPIEAFALSLKQLCEPILTKPLGEIDFAPLLVALFKTARKFKMQLLPQFVLLEKTLLYVEGLGRELYPNLDIWAIGRPLLEKWLRNQIGPEALFSAFKTHIPGLIERLPELPHLALQAIKHSQQQQVMIAEQQKEVQQLLMLILEEKKKSRFKMIVILCVITLATAAHFSF